MRAVHEEGLMTKYMGAIAGIGLSVGLGNVIIPTAGAQVAFPIVGGAMALGWVLGSLVDALRRG